MDKIKENNNTNISPKKTPKPKGDKKLELKDAYKFGFFCIRAFIIPLATGKIIGDVSVDNALGEAIASIYDPEELAKLGVQHNIALSGAAGAWQAVKKGDDEWE